MSKRLPLSRFPFFQTDDVDEAREALARVYGDGKLAPVGLRKSFSHQFNVAPLGRVTLTAMQWSCGMTFRAPSLDECFDFCSVIQGTSEARVGRKLVDADSERMVVMSPSKPLQLRWRDELLSLNAKVPRGTLESHLAALAGIELKERLEFSPAMPMSGASVAVLRLIHHMADEVNRDASLLDFPLVAERFSETLLTAVLYGQPNNYTELLVKSAQSAPPSYVRRAEEYMEAHCDQPITAQSLATVVNVSVRTLYAGFRKHREYTPVEFLRLVRLRRVRATLLAAPPDALVSKCTLRWGFTHLGRFSALYRKHFGESPSETLRRRT